MIVIRLIGEGKKKGEVKEGELIELDLVNNGY